MIFDLVAKATLTERYGSRSKPLRPYRDYAELEVRGEDPRSLRALGMLSVRNATQPRPAPIEEPRASERSSTRQTFPTSVPE